MKTHPISSEPTIKICVVCREMSQMTKKWHILPLFFLYAKRGMVKIAVHFACLKSRRSLFLPYHHHCSGYATVCNHSINYIYHPVWRVLRVYNTHQTERYPIHMDLQPFRNLRTAYQQTQFIKTRLPYVVSIGFLLVALLQ